MDAITLNTPDMRQAVLRSRLAQGGPLVAAALAKEFGVSVDTIRRDLLALEDGGEVRRIRGGAVPVAEPAAPFHERLPAAVDLPAGIAERACAQIRDGMVVLLDGGHTVLSLAQRLPALRRCLVVTPAPAAALASLSRGMETLLIGGRLSALGGIAVGAEAERAIERIAADLCLLGACGLDPVFGLSADDYEECSIKQRMAAAAHRTIVLTTADKLGRRTRHHVLACREIDRIVTDAPPTTTGRFADAGVEIDHV